jgi:hypothetical protein
VPAVAVLVFLQLGFAPASHSVARGSIEVASATTRGSIPGGALARVAELALTYGRASLPLFVFGAIGLWTTVARRAGIGDRATVRFLHFPALIYLAAVFGLVAIGAYTGSHRYLYPALPSLALLAAAALNRYAAAFRLVAVAATGLLAVGFLPVFASFAQDNAGLIAAGQAVAGSSGTLVTDSPVVAFYSQKPPAQISGSQALPLDRASAVDWLQGHGVSDLVIENISYYRAAVVFPDLAAGRPSPPFASLGNENTFRVAGGKPVYAYRVQTWSFPASQPPGEGKIAPLARGLTLRIAGSSVAGEGMGFGAPIVHYSDGWVYSRTSSTVDVSTATNAVWKRTFQLDEIGGDKAHDYSFVSIPSRGAIEVTYTIDATGVSVVVRPLWLAPGFSQVGILNEQSAAFNDFADGTKTLIGPHFPNWVAVDGSWGRLRSSSLGVEWSVPAIPGAELHAGRELIAPDFNWAGLDYLFPSTFAGTTYHVNVQEAR